MPFRSGLLAAKSFDHLLLLKKTKSAKNLIQTPPGTAAVDPRVPPHFPPNDHRKREPWGLGPSGDGTGTVVLREVAVRVGAQRWKQVGRSHRQCVLLEEKQ